MCVCVCVCVCVRVCVLTHTLRFILNIRDSYILYHASSLYLFNSTRNLSLNNDLPYGKFIQLGYVALRN